MTNPITSPTTDAARWAKILLVSGVALFFTLVVFNNTTDFDSNYQFVRHVLMMDNTMPGNRGLWRALHAPIFHLVFYLSIIAWEAFTTILTWTAVVALYRNRLAPAATFNAAKRTAILALTAGLMLWLVAFLCVGGEWFLMWQSKIWNGQEAAFRMFAVEALILGILLLPENDT
jgi:predicted small integral membrane protein